MLILASKLSSLASSQARGHYTISVLQILPASGDNWRRNASSAETLQPLRWEWGIAPQAPPCKLVAPSVHHRRSIIGARLPLNKYFLLQQLLIPFDQCRVSRWRPDRRAAAARHQREATTSVIKRNQGCLKFADQLLHPHELPPCRRR